MWGQTPVSPPNLTPPVFTQLFDLGKLMQSMQGEMQQPVPGVANMQQLEDLIRAFSTVPMQSAFPAAVLPQMNPWSNLPDWNTLSTSTWNNQPPNAPALGITREYQEDWQRLISLRQDYEAATQSFGELFRDFARKASEKFASLVTEEYLESDFDTLCRQWIDCCENEFQAIANTPEFASRLGDVINSNLKMMRLSHRMQENLTQLQGLPTRGELDSLHQKNMAAQEKIAALEQRLQQLEAKQKTKPKGAPRTRRKSDS